MVANQDLKEVKQVKFSVQLVYYPYIIRFIITSHILVSSSTLDASERAPGRLIKKFPKGMRFSTSGGEKGFDSFA